MPRPARPLALLLAVTTLLGACNGGDDGVDPGALPRVRVVHAMSNTGALELLVDATPITLTSALVYGSRTDYLAALPGDRAVAVRPVGTQPPVATATPTFAPALDYTVVAAGRVGATTGPTPRLIAFADTAQPATGTASVRVVHAAAGAAGVDVYVTAPDADLATATPVTGLAGLAFGDFSPIVSVPSGTYRIRVTNAGSKTVRIDVTGVALASGGKYTAVAVGDDAAAAPTAYNVLLFPDNVN